VGRRALAFTVVLALTGCSLGDDENAVSKPQLASGEPLPASCVPRPVRPAATVAFVANGRAWALEPRSGRLACLFPARRPGPFAWGPRGDRALLARLEVKSLGRGPTRPPGIVDPEESSWGRPIGKSIVFVGRRGRALLKVHPAGGGFTDVTPVDGVEYERVVYHPSGLAFAFVLRQGTREAVWISSNVGKTPRELVHGRLHTGFDAIAFGDAGESLYFAARHANRRVDVHRFPLFGATSAPVLWRGAPEERVTDLFTGSGPDVAFTVGRSCKTSRAVAVTGRRRAGADLLPDERPSRALGWLDDDRLLVGAGGCGEKLDLYEVDVGSLRARPLVRGVDQASARRPEPSPPPPLSPEVLGGASGFA
jgi:hypothetical protein